MGIIKVWALYEVTGSEEEEKDTNRMWDHLGTELAVDEDVNKLVDLALNYYHLDKFALIEEK